MRARVQPLHGEGEVPGNPISCSAKPLRHRIGGAQVAIGAKGDDVDVTGCSLDDAEGEEAGSSDNDEFVSFAGSGELLAEGTEQLLHAEYVFDVRHLRTR